MQIQKEVYWSECNGGAQDPGRTCESSSMCRAQYPQARVRARIIA